MKKIKLLSLGGLVLAFILSSCSMDKRVYTSGYHIQWNTDVKSESKQEVVKNTTPNKVQLENKQVEFTSSTPETISNIPANKSEVIENNFTASTDNSNTANTNTARKITRNKSNSIKTAIVEKYIERQIHKQSKKKQGESDTKILLYILCFFIPFLAVGLATDWDVTKVLINILLTLLCGIPGIIHAIIVVSKS